MVRATSSMQAFASLSTRVGRLVSRSKLIEQRVEVFGIGGGGGGGGAITDTLVRDEADWPLLSTTLQVTVMVPGEAPAVDSVTLVPVAVDRTGGRGC